MTSQNTYIPKKYIPRQQGIPLEFPLKCYKPAPGDIPPGSAEIIVGMDSGISNTAFSYIELVRDSKGALIDFRYGDSYYFKKELDEFACKIDKQIYIAQKYYELFSHKNVINLTYELLPINSTKDSDILKGLIDAQATTDIINVVAHMLNHTFTPTPATAIKYCMTGNGRASKYDMCMGAYALTEDEKLLENDHMADSFCNCFYTFINMLKDSCQLYNIPIPEKFSYVDWNYKDMK